MGGRWPRAVNPEDFRPRPVVHRNRHGKEYTKMPGMPRALTPIQEIEVVAWYKARRALGTIKTKAAEFGVSESAIVNAIQRAKRA